MKLFTRVAVLFYVTLVLFLTAFIFVYVLNLIRFNDVVDILYVAYYDHRMKLAIGIMAGVFLFFNFIFYRIFSIKVQKEKTIAFDNTSGRVTVSLFAVEDLIRSMVGSLSDVKEVRPIIVASKKGLQIELRLVLKSDVNIPDVTSQVQDLVKRKIHEVINLDEPVNVSVHVSKIVFHQGKDRRRKEDTDVGTKSELYPFQGYRA